MCCVPDIVWPASQLYATIETVPFEVKVKFKPFVKISIEHSTAT